MKHDNDDLSAHARRGELDEAGERQLLRLLGSSQEARLAHHAGQEFDREDATFADDPAVTDRILERVLAAQPLPRPAPAKGPWLKTTLAAAVIAAVAAAGPLLQRVGDESSSPSEAAAPVAPPTSKPSTASAPPPPAPAAPPLEPPRSASSSAVAPVSSSAVAPVSSSAVAPATTKLPSPRPGRSTLVPARAPQAAARAVPSASPIPPNESAGDLFARASQARRQGNTGDAMGLYERLQKQFPSSAEALSASIALGMLELKANRPEGALSQFEIYLARAPGGALAPEALWGRAQALARLGRRSASKESLRLLLERYPKSAYADAARAKLESPP